MRAVLLVPLLVLVTSVQLRSTHRRVYVKNMSDVHPLSNVTFANATGMRVKNVSQQQQMPCGSESKTRGVAKPGGYLDRLIAGVCSVETASGFACGSNIKCPLMEFYTQGCPGPLKSDVCEVCTSARQMANASQGGFDYSGGWCYEFRKFYEDRSGALGDAIISDEILGKEVCCASAIMVMDNCAQGSAIPSCF
eukprot:gnl/MRDRNA2_/MRDRNA2_31928_c0_seq1.p1 gnl/MRDRNA2_/MRDRNA2_31928_c0~~gnl/MRDRNA2_/MRDRNA2_31928_c0_seq1.p1  ORF type:complete len:194 (+),score=23.12 gnl/MRDRNA2_/MRDRNA2_31928_c0_seq1:95-676(+)